LCPPLPLPSPLITDSILFDCCVVAIVDVGIGIGIVIVVVVSPLLALLFIVPALAIIATAAAILPEANKASAIANKNG
jgi:uncharacterized membrane protein YdfJ with MMPL/SSD domain